MSSKNSLGSCFSFLRFLVVLSFPLAICGVAVASYLHYLPYKVPFHSVVMIGVIFFIYLFFIPHNAYYSSCKIVNNFKDLKHELKDKIRSTLVKINGERKSTLKLDLFLKDYFSDIRNNNYASVATTIFPMLGILGTFVSIALSMPDFSVSSTKALDREISVLLNGVGTAFYISIYGIFLSIWWMLFEKRGLSKADKYVRLIGRDFKKYIWDDVTLNHFVYAQNQINNEDLVRSLRENFNLHFMKRFNDSYLESYEKLLNDTTESFERVSKDMKNSAKFITNSLSSISDAELKMNAKIDIDKKVDRFSEVITQLDSTLDKTFIKIDTEVADIVNKLADFAEVVVKKSDDVEHSLYEYHKQVKKLIKD
jgi:hypothetical protein